MYLIYEAHSGSMYAVDTFDESVLNRQCVMSLFSPSLADFLNKDSSIFEFGRVHCFKPWMSLKTQDAKLQKSVDSDETVCCKSSHLDLHYLQRYLFTPRRMKELIEVEATTLRYYEKDCYQHYSSVVGTV